MKLKFIILLLIGNVCAAGVAYTQTAINAGSNSAMLDNEYYEYVIGEMTLVSTVQTPDVILTQGFLQPLLIIEPVEGSTPEDHAGIPNTIKVYPNPTENILFIEFVSGEASLISYQLFDAASRMIINKVEQQVEGINKFKLDVSSFAAGAYFLMIKKNIADKEPITFTYKIQKVQ